MTALPTEPEELEKRIMAMLIGGQSTICFDNVEGTIRSDVPTLAITADTFQGRRLGATEQITMPQRFVWIATGNNIDFGGDLARRFYRIRLDAHQAKPWERTRFLHNDLLGYVRLHRAEILGAMTTIVRSWVNAGMHRSEPIAMGSFTPWVQIIGGILEHAGVSDFLANASEFHSATDPEAGQWEALLDAWSDQLARRIYTAAQVTTIMEAPD